MNRYILKYIFPYVNECSLYGDNSIAYSLGEGGVRDVYARLYTTTQPIMNDMMDRVPGEELFS